jgi:hypothetical protein
MSVGVVGANVATGVGALVGAGESESLQRTKGFGVRFRV